MKMKNRTEKSHIVELLPKKTCKLLRRENSDKGCVGSILTKCCQTLPPLVRFDELEVRYENKNKDVLKISRKSEMM